MAFENILYCKYCTCVSTRIIPCRYAEAVRHDPHDGIFLDTAKDVLDALAPVIDRWPRYAWVAKHLLEPERVSMEFYSNTGR